MTDETRERRREPAGQEGARADGEGAPARSAAGDWAGNWLEGLVSGISGLLLLAVVGYLVWEGQQATMPPTFEIVTGEVRVAGERYYLPLTVTNLGSESVQNVGLDVVLKEGEATVAEAQTALPWLPAHSRREATVGFDRDPRNYRVEAAVEGFEPP